MFRRALVLSVARLARRSAMHFRVCACAREINDYIVHMSAGKLCATRSHSVHGTASAEGSVAVVLVVDLRLVGLVCERAHV